MVTLCKLALAIAGLLALSLLLSFAEGSCWDYGCYKESLFNCNNCKRKCKWKHILKDYKETEKL